ncbi:Fpg/Nei family DNA glycosylase [Cellulomonas cellasea]|uniref:DNA-(apurinic or apyrimidinic site) lyase n=2 Tax=Cellulomonas cellasea TaxID=43670 RepID=A0A0A0BA80_9CELL|nr:DNA-formamidopyrimidine glycosylase family protein [Cellulomonas cellasea]KGM02754.1 DNA glycosylase [Cellulomonas cellasea DSM 20118]GEA86684.1 formamidopyrimidine-DNA glycosylase [Cellulomonas cellasea]
MPEGHTVHRIARQLGRDLVGHRLRVTSPQGRFAAGAERLDGRMLVASRAVGKQLFLEFEGELVLRVHLGLYGAWDLHGRVTPLDDGLAPLASLGAPRVRRAVRVGEGESELAEPAGVDETFPPAPVGQVRVRLLSEETAADLRGPTACEVLDPGAAAAAAARLGPDPAAFDDPVALAAAGEQVVDAVTSRSTAVGALLMDQSVVAGIGNVYRAELLFRARLEPHTPGRRVPREVVRGIWEDWTVLLADGIRTGVMLTREDLDDAGRACALVDRDARHWVYRRAGLPCHVCGTAVQVEDMATRKLYWCPVCQV